MTPQELHKLTFALPRDPRSQAYKDGALAGMVSVLEGTSTECPFIMGTSDADAWLSGFDEGRGQAKAYKDGAS